MNRNIKKNKIIMAVLFFVLALVTANCSGQMQTEVAYATPTQTPTWLRYASPTPTPTLTEVPPVATIEDAVAFVIEQIQSNGNCELPCVFGIIMPGNTDMGSAIQFVNTLGWQGDYYPIERTLVYWAGKDINSNISINIALHGVDGVVDIIALGIGGANPSGATYFTLGNLIRSLGEPSQVWFSLGNGEIEHPSNTGISIFLFYDNQNVMLRFDSIAVAENDHFRFCLSSSDIQGQGNIASSVYAGAQSITSSPESLMEFFGGFTGEKTIEIALGINASQFFGQMIKAQGNICFDTAVETWEQ